MHTQHRDGIYKSFTLPSNQYVKSLDHENNFNIIVVELVSDYGSYGLCVVTVLYYSGLTSANELRTGRPEVGRSAT